nr:unnamed protein product [Callosobruchus chinensis]
MPPPPYEEGDPPPDACDSVRTKNMGVFDLTHDDEPGSNLSSNEVDAPNICATNRENNRINEIHIPHYELDAAYNNRMLDEICNKNDPTNITIYTDASKKSTGTGCAFYCPSTDISSSFKLPSEMSIYSAEAVAVIQALKSVLGKQSLKGFVDFGGNERRAIYADHALVFILKGIRRRWKQPICFCFCEHSTRTGDLVRTIKDVVRSVHNTGLKIVASISDQGTNNVAAIKYLLNETKAYCLSNNIENRFQGYLVDGNEIVHLYDYPHLLKGIRNSLLVKDLHFEPDGEKKVASWSHILDIYRLDQKMESLPTTKRRGTYPNPLKCLRGNNKRRSSYQAIQDRARQASHPTFIHDGASTAAAVAVLPTKPQQPDPIAAEPHAASAEPIPLDAAAGEVPKTSFDSWRTIGSYPSILHQLQPKWAALEHCEKLLSDWKW